MNKTLDLTKGKPFRLIFLFSLPILLSTFLQQAYNLVDAVIVGQCLDSNYFGAVSASNTIMQLFVALMIGLSTGASVVVSQLFGAHRLGDLKKAVSTIFISILSFTLLLSIIGIIFTRPLLTMMNVVPEYLDPATEYLRIVFVGLVPMMIYNIYSGILRGVGNSKAPLYFLVISTFLNIGLDLWFVSIWGVQGIAVATVTANVVSAILCIIYTKLRVDVLFVKTKDFKFDKGLFKKVIMTGLPAALEQTCMYVSILLLQIIVSSFDIGTGQTVHLSGYGVGNRIIDFLNLPLFAIGNALAAYSAQNRGAGEIKRVQQGYLAGIALSVIMLCFTVIPGLIFSEQLIGLIINVDGGETTAGVIKVAKEFIFALNPFCLILAAQFLTNNTLRGAGDVFVPFMNIITAMVIRTLVAYVCFWTFGNYIYAFYAFPLSWLISGTWAVIRFCTGKWKNKHLLERI